MLESKQKSSLSGTSKSKSNFDDGLDITLKSEFTETIKESKNPSELKNLTVSRLNTLSREIMNDPGLVLDETFLSCTLSLSNNNDLLAFSNKNAMKKKGKALDISESEESLNF